MDDYTVSCSSCIQRRIRNSCDVQMIQICLHPLYYIQRQHVHASLFQKCGTQTRTRFIDISNVAASVGPDVCKSLLGMRALIGAYMNVGEICASFR